MPKSEARLVAQLSRWSRWLALATVAVGAGTLNLGFVPIGAALWSLRWPWLASLLAVGTMAAGIAARAEPNVAICFLLTGLALLSVSTRHWPRVGQLFAGLVALVALMGLFGHAYAVKAFFGLSTYSKMPLGAALGFLLATPAIWFARPDDGFMTRVVSDGAGGFAVRRLYPAVILLPLLLGGLTLAGGGRLFNGKFGLSAMVLLSIVGLMMVVGWAAGAIDKSDHARLRLATVLLEETERRNLARELHDEIGQSLTALKVRLEMVPAGPELALVNELMARVSNLSLDLRPAMLDDLGLLPALMWLLDRYRAQTGIAVEFAHEGLDAPRLSPDRETAAFRIVQEALSNAARHSGAERVTVHLFRRGGRLSVQVEDGGKGFDPDAVLAAASSSGLLGMRERAAALGGRLTIEAAIGQGTRLHAELPIS